ncbi:MAG: jacalin-like lectin [Byssovorax sp.]
MKTTLLSLVALSTLLPLASGCAAAAGDDATPRDNQDAAETLGTISSKVASYDDDADSVLANDFRPIINLKSSHGCMPLTFKEDLGDAKYIFDYGVDSADLKDFCRDEYSSNFVITANVVRDATRSQTFRITYGVAFGMQYSHLDSSGLLDAFNIVGDDIGTHGSDAQYIVVDVVDGKLTSVWADLHKGNYVVPKDWLNITVDGNGNHVNVYAGKYYNSLKLYDWVVDACDVSEDSSYSGSDAIETFCGASWSILDYYMNFGDPLGTDHQGYGQLVMAQEACVGTSYTSRDGSVYSGDSLTALRAYIGCSGEATTNVWSGSYYMGKSAYTGPYSLAGCKSGELDGGDICNGSIASSNDTWTTFSGTTLYMEPDVAGKIRLEHSTGSAFNDMISVSNTARPTSITVRTGVRVDAVSTTYSSGDVKGHGGTGGTAQTISSLDTDPVIKVEMCDGTKDDDTRVGYIKLTTLGNRTISGGQGSSNCETIAPSGMELRGFYGRKGTEMDVLGTYWGPLVTTPTASNASHSVTGNKATASYTFSDQGGLSDASTYSWQRSATGSTSDASTVASSSSYTLSASDSQQYLRFCVTPGNGYKTGSQVCSSWASVGHVLSFYQHNSSGGTSTHFAYEKSAWGSCFNMTSYSFNDMMSSLTFRTPTTNTATVWLYKDGNCSGPVVTYTVPANQVSSVSSMATQWGSTWNDAVSSFKVTW